MAQKMIVRLEDDLDGGPAAETVRFRYEGTDYEIDLSAANARAFREELAPFIKGARTLARLPAHRATRTAARRQRSADIRAWANEQGIPVSKRGRIPASVLEHYEAAAKGQ
jgi:Lsr2